MEEVCRILSSSLTWLILRRKKSWMSFALWFQITFQNSFSVEIRQISLTHRHTTFAIVFFSWYWSGIVILDGCECATYIFIISPLPKLSHFPPLLTPLMHFPLFLEFEFILFFINSQLVSLCCQIISHLFLITFVCTWFLFTHQGLYGISFYHFPESME